MVNAYIYYAAGSFVLTMVTETFEQDLVINSANRTVSVSAKRDR